MQPPDHPPVSAPPAEPDHDPDVARRRRRLEQVDAIAGTASQLIHVVAEHALGRITSEVGERVAGSDVAVTFERLSRSFQRVVALEAKIDVPPPVARSAAVRRDASSGSGGGSTALEHTRAERLSPSVEAHRRALRKRARQYLETAIKAAAPPQDFEHLLGELDHLLENPAVIAELNVKPIGLMVGRLCDELGVKADLSKFTDEELGFAEQMNQAMDAYRAMAAQLPKLPTGFIGSPGVPPAEPLPPFVFPLEGAGTSQGEGPPEGEGTGEGRATAEGEGTSGPG